MKKLLLVLLSLSFILSTHAQNETSYEVEAFHDIEVHHNFKVFLSQGNDYSVTAHVPEGYGDLMLIEVKSGTLILAMKSKTGKNKNNWSFGNNSVTIKNGNNKASEKIKIYVTFPTIDALEVGGVSEIVGLTPLTLKDFEMEVSGAANVKLDLNANVVELDQSGASKAELTLAANQIAIDLSGSSKNQIQLSEELKSFNADLSGAAYLEITGSTDAFEADISGAAQIIAPSLNVSTVKIKCSGAAKVKVGQVAKLMVNGSGASNVKYKESETETEITFEKSGAASITTY